jgi:hypothetical protein
MGAAATWSCSSGAAIAGPDAGLFCCPQRNVMRGARVILRDFLRDSCEGFGLFEFPIFDQRSTNKMRLASFAKLIACPALNPIGKVKPSLRHSQ